MKNYLLTPKTLFTFALFTALQPFVFASQNTVDYAELDFMNEQTGEPMKLSFWYPRGENCSDSEICLANDAQTHQGIIISHGATGSARESNWIGYATASQGIVTVGMNHYGESWVYGPETMKPGAVTQMWRRTADITYALNLLKQNALPGAEKKQLFNKAIQWDNSTAIGFSSGGSTVIALAGGILDPMQGAAYCDSSDSSGDLGCTYAKGKTFDDEHLALVSTDQKDERIKRVISLDPGLGHMTTPESLKNIAIPVMIVGAKQNDFLPYHAHAGYYASQIPNAHSMVLDNGEGHFVFIDKCDNPYKAQGIPLCEDKEGVDRQVVQKKLYPEIFTFIYSNQ